ncbi:glycosyltransferase family 4 protein [Actinomadura rudentiformis]|uniref:glycosyltransferase family 4 protein n=1 Tax=Actinomadura rudentiformis TaxID=359158 RepID=UPI001CEF70AA|nr:glycosyltransferase family 4 protein [Actinomadura rudentiformis]
MSDCFLPRLGGIEVQVDELSRAQLAADHDVSIATATPCRTALPEDEAFAAGSPFAAGRPCAGRPPVDRLVAPMPWELPVGRSLRPVLEERKPDVVHVHAGAASPFAWRAVPQARRAAVPVVLTVHSLWGPVSRSVYRGLFASWARTAGGLVVTAVSEAAAAPIRQVVGGRLPVLVVANGIDTSRWHDFTHAPTRLRTAGDALHVVAVGRLAPRKEPMNLLRLLRDVGSVVPIRATIVGDGPARTRMERYLRRHGMSGWVRLTGRLDRSAVRVVLAQADVFVAPAARESFGLAALEARLAGLPVIAQTGSGVADFVESGREGLLGRTFPEMAAALLRLADDHRLRNRIAAHNRATEPMRCTWPAVLEAFDGCYELASAKTPLAHL